MKTVLNTFRFQCGRSGFPDIPYELVVNILRSDNLVVHSELDILVAAVYWSVCSEVKNIENSKLKSEMFNQFSNLLMRHGLCSKEIKFHEVEHATRKRAEIGALFECMDVDNLGVSDLQRVGRFC